MTMRGILALSLLVAAPEVYAQSPRLHQIPADSTVCVRTTRYFPEIRQSLHCASAARWGRMEEEARSKARAEERLRQRRMQAERDWERRQELARTEEREARDRAERRDTERRRSEDRRLAHQGKMPR